MVDDAAVRVVSANSLYCNKLSYCLERLAQSENSSYQNREISRCTRRLHWLRQHCELDLLLQFKCVFHDDSMSALILEMSQLAAFKKMNQEMITLIEKQEEKALALAAKFKQNNSNDLKEHDMKDLHSNSIESGKSGDNLEKGNANMDDSDDIQAGDAMEIEPENATKESLIQSMKNNNSELIVRFLLVLIGYYLTNAVVYYDDECSPSHLQLLSKYGDTFVNYVLKIFDSSKQHFDLLDARLFSQIARIYQCSNRMQLTIDTLMMHYRVNRTADNTMCVATIINQVLFAHIEQGQFEAALKFLAVHTFPENIRSAEQISRYLFSIGRVKLLTGEYTDSLDNLSRAQMKLASASHYAFQLTLMQHIIIAKLLLGEIPSLRLFQQKEYVADLQPYYELVSSVHLGNVTRFQEIVLKHEKEFSSKRLLSVVQRLNSTVVRRGLILISQAYKRIRLEDVQARLGLASLPKTVGVIIRAVKDGIISSTVDAEAMVLICVEEPGMKNSHEFARNIIAKLNYCFSLQNLAVKSLEYREPEDLQAKAIAYEKLSRSMLNWRASDSDISDSEI